MIYAGLAVGLAFFLATWDEDNHWKVLFCAVILFVSLTALRAMEYRDGYEDATCDVYEAIDRSDKANVKNIPEFCDG